MSTQNNNFKYILKNLNKIINCVYILLFVLIIYIFILISKNLNILNLFISIFKIFSPLFIGMLIAWLLRPIVNCFEKHNINRILVLVFIYIFILFILFLFIIIFIPRFVKEIADFVRIFPDILNKFIANFNFIKLSKYQGEIFNTINTYILNIGKGLPVTFVNIVKGISSFLVGVVISFYLLISKSILTINADIKKDTYKLILKINDIFRNYVKGIFISTFVVFILCIIIFYILGLDNALLFGFICGITNIIPFIGPYIGAIIPVLVAFTNSIPFGIIVLLTILVIQIIEGNVIQPIIMSKSVNIHPVISIMSLIIFGHFFGIIGMVFAIPVVASIREVYFYFKGRYKRFF